MDIQTRRRAPETTRAEIIDMAIEVAAEQGATGLTLDAVVARLSFSKGALLHHFPSKLALLEGMIDHLAGMMTEMVLEEAKRDPEPYGRNARAYLRATVMDPVTERDVRIGQAALVACAIEPGLVARWRAAMRTLCADDPVDPAGKDDALMLRLLADGLWMNDLFGIHEMSEEQRTALLSLLTPGAALPDLLERVR